RAGAGLGEIGCARNAVVGCIAGVVAKAVGVDGSAGRTEEDSTVVVEIEDRAKTERAAIERHIRRERAWRGAEVAVGADLEHAVSHAGPTAVGVAGVGQDERSRAALGDSRSA